MFVQENSGGKKVKIQENWISFRFRARPKKDESNGSLNHDSKKQHPAITHPKTPNLMTKSRSRPVTTLSAQEIEEKELEEMKKLVHSCFDYLIQ